MSTSRAAYVAERRAVGRGGAWGGLAVVVATLTGPPVTVATVRLLSHQQYGLLAMAAALIGPAAAVAGLGLGPATTQVASVAASRYGVSGSASVLRTAERAAWRALPWVMVGTAVLVGVSCAVSTLRSALAVTLVLSPIVLVAPWQSVFDGFLRAIGSVRRVGLAGIVASMSGAAFLIPVFLLDHPTAAEVAAARVLGTLLGVGVLAEGGRRWRRRKGVDATRLQERDERAYEGKLWRLGVAMLLSSLGFLLISQLDVLILGIVRGSTEAGIYAPSSRLADMAVGLAVSIGGFLLPALAAAVALGEHDKAAHLYHWTSGWSLVVCAPLLALMVVVPAELLPLLFGPGFQEMAGPTRLLGVGVLIHVALGFNGFALDAYGVAEAAARRAAAGIVVSLVLCLVLIPTQGALGAAIATMAALAVVNVFSSATLWRRFQVPPFDRWFGLTTVMLGVGLGAAALARTTVDGDLARCVLVVVVATVPPMVVVVAEGRVARREGAAAKGLTASSRHPRS